MNAEPFASGQAGPPAAVRCLLIDDSKFDRQQMCRIARQTRLNLDFTEAENVDAALNALRGDGFDVILLDQTLPDGDGTTVAALLAQHLGAELPPIIMISGSDEAALPARAIAAGCVDFVCKDKLNIPRIEKAIRDAMARRSLAAGMPRLATDGRDAARDALARLGRQAARLAEQQAAAARELARLEAMLEEFRRALSGLG